MYALIRKALFSLDAEQAHDLTIKTLKTLGRSPFNPLLKTLFACPTGSPKTIMGLHFKNQLAWLLGQIKMAKLLMVLQQWDLALLKWER